MKNVIVLLETYLMVLVHPFRIHHQFRFNLPIPNQGGHTYRPLTLAESLGISWVFAIVRGLGKIIILNFFLQIFVNMQSEGFPLLEQMIRGSGISTYYFLLFSAALDIIFFPVGRLILTEFWAWLIRLYAGWLDPDLPREVIADQITTHALSANFFNMIPFLGDMIEMLLYHFLLYAGLRSNLGASRSFAWIVLLTPMLIGAAFFALFLVFIFYLMG